MAHRTLLVLLVLLTAQRAFPLSKETDCGNKKDEDADGKIDCEDSDCNSNPCVSCMRSDLEVFFGRTGRGIPPVDGVLRLDAGGPNVVSLRYRSAGFVEEFRLGIVLDASGARRVYSIESPQFTIGRDGASHVDSAKVVNELVTSRRVISVAPGPVFDGSPSGDLLEITATENVIELRFQGDATKGVLIPAKHCEGYELLRLELGPADVPFRRADTNADGRSDLADAIAILDFLFRRGPELPCEAAADVDVGGSLNIADPIRILIALFGGGPPIPAPFPDCGERSPEDRLECASYSGCGG